MPQTYSQWLTQNSLNDSLSNFSVYNASIFNAYPGLQPTVQEQEQTMSTAITPMDGFKFGADPELFLQTDDGEFICADGLIPGTKAEPYKVEHGAVQVDGMAAEFNIDPVDNFADFDRNIKEVLRQLKGFLPKNVSLKALPAVEFSQAVWDLAPDRAKELGCSPDFNAWTGAANPPPENLEKPRLRTASGHLHIGWSDDESTADPDHVGNCRDLVQQLDWYLGHWSMGLDPDATRRSLYGKAGACRFKPYGVEYRVLSNFWVNDTRRRLAVWNRMQAAILDMREDFKPKSVPFKYSTMLVQSIDSSTRNRLMEDTFRFPLRELKLQKYA